MGLEPGEGVLPKHARPRISVIAGRIAVAPDVQEIVRTVTRRDIGGVETALGESVRLELVDVLERRACRQRMPVEVEMRGLEYLADLIALIEGAGGEDLLHQLLRDGLSRFVVHRIVREDLGIGRPVLVELRRELDEIARDVGALQSRISLRREHAVKRVTELVEHRRHVVEADQRWLPGRGLGEVLDVVDHRLGAAQV